MIAVIFEAWPGPDGQSRYLDLAAELRSRLDAIDGFISIERFASLSEAGKLLSLSFWRDQEAVSAWRSTVEHRSAQTAGRLGILRDYRLRVADVLRDYGASDRAQAPADSRAAHDARFSGGIDRGRAAGDGARSRSAVGIDFPTQEDEA